MFTVGKSAMRQLALATAATTFASVAVVSQVAHAQSGTNSDTQANLQEVDTNSNQLAEWPEISQTYSSQIDRVGWDQEQIMTSFNQDQDGGLNEREFDIFVDSLNREQELSANQFSGQNAEQQSDVAYGTGQQDFNRIDADGNQQVQWQELQQTYSQPLGAAGWDREQVLSAYDQNQNQALEENEFLLFVTDLQLATSEAELPVAANRQNGSQNVEPGRREQGVSLATGEPVNAGSVAGSQNQQTQNQRSLDQGAQQNQQAAQGQQSSQQRTSQTAGATGSGSTSANAQESNSESQASVSVARLQNIPVEEINGRDLFSSAGEEIGTVKDVARSQDGRETVLIVRTGGFLGIGGKDLAVGMDEVFLKKDQLVWESSSGSRGVEDLPTYNGEDFVSVR